MKERERESESEIGSTCAREGTSVSVMDSVTRYWSKNVAQMFSKVAQIDAAAVFTFRNPFSI